MVRRTTVPQPVEDSIKLVMQQAGISQDKAVVKALDKIVTEAEADSLKSDTLVRTLVSALTALGRDGQVTAQTIAEDENKSFIVQALKHALKAEANALEVDNQQPLASGDATRRLLEQRESVSSGKGGGVPQR